MYTTKVNKTYRALVVVSVLAALCRSMIAPGFMLSMDGPGLPSLALCPSQNPGLSNWLVLSEEHHHHSAHGEHQATKEQGESLPAHGEVFNGCTFWGGSVHYFISSAGSIDALQLDNHSSWHLLRAIPFLKQGFYKPHTRGPPVSKHHLLV